MLQAAHRVDSTDIIRELKHRGYGIDACHGWAFRLAVRKGNTNGGSAVFEPIGGVRVVDLEIIQTSSRDAVHAADRVESLSTGQTHDVRETDDRGGGDTVKLETLAKMIDNKIDAKLDSVNAALAAISRAIGATAPEPIPPGGAPIQPMREASEPRLVQAPAAEDPEFATQPAAVETQPPPPTGEDDPDEFADCREPEPAKPQTRARKGWPKGKKRGPRKARKKTAK